jgi:predicted DCC family thiol-disulfide oxidoreductase YuxK
MADHSMVFYDGGCGLCHRAVRFALAHDADGSRFRFASLDSEGFRRRVPPAARAGLPDSIVALTPDGTLLVRSAAVIHILERVGGWWRLLGRLLGIVPRRVRDAGYDAVARVRHRLFRRPDDACPVTPLELRARFEE